MTKKANDQVMTLDELAHYLKVPKSTLYKTIQDGRVPGQKIGKQWRFSKAAIDSWLASQNQKQGED